MTYIAKGTPNGHDVRSAIDYINTFDSSSPTLKLDRTGQTTSSVSHNLGYFPLFFITYGAGGSFPGTVSQFSEAEWSVDTNSLIRSSGSGLVRYFIGRHNISSNFYSEHRGGTTLKSPGTDEYVFKIAKDGKSLDSSDMRDFSLHSETTSPLISSIDYGKMVLGTGGYYVRSFKYNLPYTPLVFVYMKPSLNSLSLSTSRMYMMHPPIGATTHAYVVDTDIGGSGGVGYVTAFASTFDFSSPPDVSIVVFKDPFNKQEINVTYP